MKNIISNRIKYTIIENTGKIYNAGLVKKDSSHTTINTVINIFDNFEIINIKKTGNLRVQEVNSDDFFYIKRKQLLEEKSTYNQSFFNDMLISKKSSSLHFKNNVLNQSIGLLDGNIFFLQEDVDPFKDTQPTNPVFDLIKEDPKKPNYDYPVVFNDKKIHRRGGRIDHFEIIEEIKINKTQIGEVLGFKSHKLSFGTDSLGRNLLKTDKFYKHKNLKGEFFEDDIDEKYIFIDEKQQKISTVTYSLIDGVSSASTTTYKEEIQSNEPRYFVNPKEYEKLNSSPYKDANIKSKNYWDYGLRKNNVSSDINKILLENRIGNEYSFEDHVYATRGRDYDYEKSTGVDSLVYYDLEN